MEGMYFSTFVLGMCALHLMFRTSGQMEAWWRNHSTQTGRSGAETGRKSQRSDWYAFFHCDDLVGKKPAGKGTQTEKSSDQTTERKDRRPRVAVR